MAVYRSIDNLPEFENPIITIGTFDGVHAGHKVILDKVVAHANDNNKSSVLVTFDPHPRKLIFPEETIDILTPLNEKLELITATGIEHVVVVPFTKEFAQLSAQEYISDFLVKKLKPSTIIIGYDHHFGNDRKGNIELLQKMKAEYGFGVIEIEAQLIQEAAISSTKIRTAIAYGNIEEAAKMLNRNYSVTGIVQRGQQLGRKLNYPTANISPLNKEQLLPANGVYAIYGHYDKARYSGMLNIGIRPTIDNDKTLHIEAHLFDFNQEIYNEQLKVEFVKRIRDEVKFDSIDALKAQLDKDAISAKDVLAKS